MKLYTIQFEHFSQKDSKEGIQCYLVADNDEQVFAYMSRVLAFWSDIHEVKEYYDEDKRVYVESTFKDWVIRQRGTYWVDPSDLYYGHTNWKWNEGVEVNKEELFLLGDIGIEIETLTAFISGHLDLTDEEFNEHYEEKIIEGMDNGWRFLVGDAPGTDTRAQQLLRSYPNVTVLHMLKEPRNNAGHTTRGGFESDNQRDAWGTYNSDVDIAWVRPGRENSGTARNLERRKRH